MGLWKSFHSSYKIKYGRVKPSILCFGLLFQFQYWTRRSLGTLHCPIILLEEIKIKFVFVFKWGTFFFLKQLVHSYFFCKLKIIVLWFFSKNYYLKILVLSYVEKYINKCTKKRIISIKPIKFHNFLPDFSKAKTTTTNIFHLPPFPVFTAL